MCAVYLASDDEIRCNLSSDAFSSTSFRDNAPLSDVCNNINKVSPMLTAMDKPNPATSVVDGHIKHFHFSDTPCSLTHLVDTNPSSFAHSSSGTSLGCPEPVPSDEVVSLIDASVAKADILSTDEKQRLRALLIANSDLFTLRLRKPGTFMHSPHTIDTGDHPPIRSRPYRTSHKDQQVIDAEIQRMLEDGVIQPSIESLDFTSCPCAEEGWQCSILH